MGSNTTSSRNTSIVLRPSRSYIIHGSETVISQSLVDFLLARTKTNLPKTTSNAMPVRFPTGGGAKTHQRPADEPLKKKRPTAPSVSATQVVEEPNRTFMTVKQTAQRFPIFTEAAIRFLIFQAEGAAKNPDVNLRSNGFLKVIFRVPGQRRILINEQALIAWLQSGR